VEFCRFFSVRLGKPSVLQNFFDRKPRALTFLKHAGKEVFAVFAYSAPDFRVERELTINYFTANRVSVIAVERNCCADESVHDDAEAPDVGLEIAGLVPDDFW